MRVKEERSLVVVRGIVEDLLEGEVERHSGDRVSFLLMILSRAVRSCTTRQG
jgi:hypothetical protein